MKSLLVSVIVSFVLVGACNSDNSSSSCVLPEGASNDPQTIGEFINYVNALPKPTDINCVVENLQRPLFLAGSSGKASAQPATGEESPRIFIRRGDKLLLSFVGTGDMSDAIELSELTENEQSIKGELKFPVKENIIESSPFKTLMVDKEARCASKCHLGLEEVKTYDDGTLEYASPFLTIRKNDYVDSSEMKTFWGNCKIAGDKTSQLCKFYDAMFGPGEVKDFRLLDMLE